MVKSASDGLVGPVTTKLVWRSLVYSAVLIFGSAVLYAFAVLGYLGFYHDYLPDQIRTIPVHLQYGYVLPF